MVAAANTEAIAVRAVAEEAAAIAAKVIAVKDARAVEEACGADARVGVARYAGFAPTNH